MEREREEMIRDLNRQIECLARLHIQHYLHPQFATIIDGMP